MKLAVESLARSKSVWQRYGRLAILTLGLAAVPSRPAWAAAYFAAGVDGRNSEGPSPVSTANSTDYPSVLGGTGFRNGAASAGRGKVSAFEQASLAAIGSQTVGEVSSLGGGAYAVFTAGDLVITPQPGVTPPPDGLVPVSCNLHVSGSLLASAYANGDNRGGCTASAEAHTSGGISGFGQLFAGGIANQMGANTADGPGPLLADRSGIFDGTGDEATTPTVYLPINTPLNITLNLNVLAVVHAEIGGNVHPITLQADAKSNFGSTIAFSYWKPVLNLPEGYTADSAEASIASNLYYPEPARMVPAGSVWRFRDDGSDQGTAWREINFDETGWTNVGPAELGYGDNVDNRPEATVVSFGSDAANKYVTTYFRHTWSVPDATSFTNLTLRLLRDAGAVAYLNGTEVYRSNMPTGAVDYTTLATAAVEGVDETIFFETKVNSTLLLTGTNVLAVEVHQSAADGPDLSFDLELVGETDHGHPPLTIARSSTGLIVRWPSRAQGFRLVATENLVPPVSWQPVNDVPDDNGIWKSVALTNEASRKFYQLAKR